MDQDLITEQRKFQAFTVCAAKQCWDQFTSFCRAPSQYNFTRNLARKYWTCTAPCACLNPSPGFVHTDLGDQTSCPFLTYCQFSRPSLVCQGLIREQLHFSRAPGCFSVSLCHRVDQLAPQSRASFLSRNRQRAFLFHSVLPPVDAARVACPG